MRDVAATAPASTPTTRLAETVVGHDATVNHMDAGALKLEPDNATATDSEHANGGHG